MRVLCLMFNNTFVAYNCTIMRIFGDTYSLQIVFTQSGPEARSGRIEFLGYEGVGLNGKNFYFVCSRSKIHKNRSAVAPNRVPTARAAKHSPGTDLR